MAGSNRVEPAPDRRFELAALPATDLLKGYAEGRFTPVDVIEEVVGALEVTDALCNVVVTDMYESALSEAKQATADWAAGKAKGRLAGVPVTVKDLLFVAGVPAHAGSPKLADFVPSEDSAVVSMLKAEGAIITCKTTTCESGYKLTADSPLSGITRNPWNPGRTSGGSSGGAAAAVAAGCGPLAIGTDAVGSIRVPSSFCGVFGIKPTFGLVPRAPSFFPPSWGSLAHTGPIGWTVSDVALLLEVIAGYDRRDAVSLPVAPRRFDASPASLDGLRIGVSPDFGYAPVAPAVRQAFQAAVDALADSGAEMVEVDVGFGAETLETVLQPIGFTEQATAVMDRDAVELARSDAEFRSVVDKGKGLPRHRLHGGDAPADPASRPLPQAVRHGRCAGDADSGGHCLRSRHDRRRRDRRRGGRPASRLVAVLVADQSRRAAGGERPLRFRRGRPADRIADRRALARRGGHLPDRRRLRGGAAVGACPPARPA